MTRALPSAVEQKLRAGVTTFCRCWLIERQDGTRMGFTDHDGPLSFGGDSFQAMSGFTAGAVERSTGLSVDTQSITGALRSGAITEEDIARGLYDDARVTSWLVDWRAPGDRVVLGTARIGEIRRRGAAFEAELVGLSARLNRPAGRAYLASCHRTLGDQGCGIDLSDPAYRGTGLVSAVAGDASLVVTGLGAFADDWFTNGTLIWNSGANLGAKARVRRHLAAGEEARIDLWLSAPLAVVPGDGFEIVAGCDKTAETCKAKFSNFLNFGGFPHMPGDDWTSGYADAGGTHDGGSLYRS